MSRSGNPIEKSNIGDDGFQFLQQTFHLDPKTDPFVDSFPCWYDSFGLHSGHMYITQKHICWHTHDKERKYEVMAFSDLIEMEKRNSILFIPNAISLTPKQGFTLFFSFLNRAYVFNLLHLMWKGQAHDKDCVHTFHPSTLSTMSVDFEMSDVDAIPKNHSKEILKKPLITLPISREPIETYYDLNRKIGSGHFSIVKLARDKRTGIERAVKVITRTDMSQENEKTLTREIEIIRKIQHPNIIAVVEVFENATALFVVMELAMGGELFDAIISVGKYGEQDAARFMKQIASAVAYLHSIGIVHRDLKPENLLLTDRGPDAHVKIADFGLSKIMETTAVLETKCGTPGYVAPEVLMGNGYAEKVDVWSMGVILYILLCGFPPFYAENNDKLFEKIMSGNWRFLSPYWDPISVSAKDLISHMIVLDPNERMSASQVLNHPWTGGKTASMELLPDVQQKLKTSKEKEQTQRIMQSSSVARLAVINQSDYSSEYSTHSSDYSKSLDY